MFAGHLFAAALALATAAPAPMPADPPVVPHISKAMASHLRGIVRDGRRLGNRAAVFAKIGDSITESGSFLTDVGCGQARLGRHRRLASTIRYFSRVRLPVDRAVAWCGRSNSFTRASVSAVSGWDAGHALARFGGDAPTGCPPPHDRPLRCELHLLRPSIALVMYGTNDLERTGTRTYSRRLRAITRETVAAGVVPVLSTIPSRRDSFAPRVARFNRAIAEVAAAERVPLWNFWRAVTRRGMVRQGISDDGIHPSVYGGCEPPLGCASADLTSAGLRYGYNQRNLTALEVLAALRRTVLAGR
jgi:hypothetical protein